MALFRVRPLIASLVMGILAVCTAIAQIPPGYYDTADTSSPAALRASLHEIIDDHTKFPYTSTAIDTWDILEIADADPNNASNILDIYMNESYPAQGGGNNDYNREHSWPKSYGFPDDVSSNYPYTDCHHLFLCNDSYNSSRNNKPYRFCDAGCSENPTVANNGQGGGSGVYPGNSNWTSGSNTDGTWETWIGRRGDVARALFYMDVRYEGGTHGITGHSEPDLILTDNEALIASSNTGQMESVGYMGMLSVLLQWHAQDPVDAQEIQHMEAVASFQGNRNPFVDHPEWVACIFEGNCGGGGDTTPPAVPTGLTTLAGTGQVDLDWADNGESDLAGYNVYRSTTSGSGYAKINGGLLTSSYYVDSAVSGGTTYYYVVTAVDDSSNESGNSAEASATPDGGVASGDPWINEIHYNNVSGDVGEFFEIAGPAGASLSGWSIIGYNGSGGSTYDTVPLSGTIPTQQGCMGTLSFAMVGMQNGAPDGLALVDDGGQVVEFISYQGTFTAVGGPADGLLSVDIGVAEDGNTPVGYSLQLGGTGAARSDFTWQSQQAETPGSVNTGQTFDGCGGGDTTPPAAPTGLGAISDDGQVLLDWADNTEPDLAGYNVLRSTTSGSGHVQINGSTVANSDFIDTGVTNGTTYYYVVTALDTSANESSNSGEASGTPQDLTAPSAPFGLMATAGDAQVDLDWVDNTEPDLAGYNVLRSETSGGPYTQLNGSLVATSDYSDTSVVNDTTYYYVATAVDTNSNESPESNEDSATPTGAGGTDITNLTNADFSTDSGTVSGSHTDTHASDNSYEALTEVTSGGKPANRHSLLSHTWTLNVASGSSYLFSVEAHHSASSDGDDFVFSYSTDNVSYTPMVTVTKTSDDNTAQTFSLPGNVSGTLYIRAEDTDSTQGNQALDTLFVDHLFVLTTAGGGGDTTPPNAPTGLAATAGNGQVSLDWADNGEPDLAGYNVLRSTSSGGPYTQINGSLVASSDYVDTGVTNGTTYYYVVTALDTSSNASGNSNEDSATPAGGGGDPTSTHVSAIFVQTANAGQGNKDGQALVTVLDDQGGAVANATVTGTFTGSYNETQQGTTDASGVATITTSATQKGGVTFTFCVDSITHATLTYDSGSNAITCNSL